MMSGKFRGDNRHRSLVKNRKTIFVSSLSSVVWEIYAKMNEDSVDFLFSLNVLKMMAVDHHCEKVGGEG